MLKNEKENLKKLKKNFLEFRAQELQKIDKDKQLFKENLLIVESLKCKDSDIFDLDIGGTHKISTTKNTLLKVFLNF